MINIIDALSYIGGFIFFIVLILFIPFYIYIVLLDRKLDRESRIKAAEERFDIYE